jgi:hypothetical protein
MMTPCHRWLASLPGSCPVLIPSSRTNDITTDSRRRHRHGRTLQRGGAHRPQRKGSMHTCRPRNLLDSTTTGRMQRRHSMHTHDVQLQRPASHSRGPACQSITVQCAKETHNGIATSQRVSGCVHIRPVPVVSVRSTPARRTHDGKKGSVRPAPPSPIHGPVAAPHTPPSSTGTSAGPEAPRPLALIGDDNKHQRPEQVMCPELSYSGGRA